jgi:hypothetical protein
MESLGRNLIVVGIVLAALGALVWASPSIPWLGRLPGDIRIERPGFRFYLPITSCLVVSGLVSLAWWLFTRLR